MKTHRLTDPGAATFGHAAGDSSSRPAWIRLLPWLAYIAVIAVTTIGVSGWTLNRAHYFYADDWGWLERAAFGDWHDLLRLAPTHIYNDRPAGQVFIELMYRWFGLDAHAYNILWLLLHVFNSILLFILAARELPRNRALMAALLAGCWYSTLIAVHWVAAIFDLAGATWCMLCLLFYLQATKQSRWAPLWLFGAVCMHVLAIRTKEFALAMIAVLACWEFLLVESRDLRGRLLRLAPHVLVTLVYVLIYLRLYEAQKAFVSAGIYRMSISPAGILENTVFYLAQAFYVPEKWSGHAALLAGFMLLAGVVLLGCSSRKALAAVISACALMAAVLLMPNQRNALYLYAPHFLLALALCTVAPRNRFATLATGVLVAVLISWPFFSGNWRSSRNFYLNIGTYSQQLFVDYAKLMDGRPIPKPLTIGVSRTYFDPFSWGKGTAMRIRSGNPDVTANVVKLAGPQDDVCARVSGTCLIEHDGHLILRQGEAPAGTTVSPPSPLKSRHDH